LFNFVLALPERASKVREMQALLRKLPVPHFDTLKFLFAHLTRWVLKLFMLHHFYCYAAFLLE